MRKINLKLFLGLIVATILFGAGIYVVHRFQAGRIASALLWQVERAERDNNPEKAVVYLKRYLDFRPHDREQRAHLGRTLADDRLAINQQARERALFVLEPVITREPQRNDLRRLVVRLAMALKPPRWDTVNNHLNALETAYPEDAEVAALWAGYHEAAKDGDLSKAVQSYKKAIKLVPGQGENYVRLAALYRDRLNQPEDADSVMNQLVQTNPASFQACLQRGRYRIKNRDLNGAEQDVSRARELAPDEPDVLLAAADLAVVHKQWDQARQHLNRGLTVHPADARFYSALSQVEIHAQNQLAAIRCLERGVQAVPQAAKSELLWNLGNLCIDRHDWPAAENVIGQLTQTSGSSIAIPYLQARLLFGKEDWSNAARLLENVRGLIGPPSDANKELLVQVELYLGQCYDQLNEPTRQLAAFQRATELNPKSEAALLGLAAAQRALGRTRAAEKSYEQLTSHKQGAARLIELARLQMESKLATGNKDFKNVEETVRRAEEVKSKTEQEEVDLVLLRAQVWAAQNQLDRAREFLTAARDKDPQQIHYWMALAEIIERQGNPGAATSTLDEAEQECGDSVELRLARARHWANRRSPDAGSAVVKLGDRVESFAPDSQARLLGGLAEVLFRLGKLQEAEQLWNRLAELPRHQNDLRLRMILFDLALQAGNDPGMQRALKAIQAIEGTEGSFSRYGAALRLIWLGKNGHAEHLDEARGLLDQVTAERPTWPAVLLAKAEIETLKGNPSQAIAFYRKAQDLGEQGPRVIRPLVQLLYQSQRYREAERVMAEHQNQLVASKLLPVAAETFLRNQDPLRAAKMALDAVAADSTDYHDYLWLGQMLSASGGHAEEAEKKLRRAVDLAPGQPETWVALVQFLVRVNRMPDAQAVMERAQSTLPPDQAPLALAECSEVLGRAEQAQKYYQTALATKPNDVLVLRGVAGFLMRVGRPRDAEPFLRRILDQQVKAGDRDVSWARRGLAMVLVARGAPLAESLSLVGLKLDSKGKLVEEKPLPNEEAVDEERARARVLATQKIRALRDKAIALLEDLNQRLPLNADDQFLLAQLYEAVGNWPKACEQLQKLIAPRNAKPLYLAHYAQGMIFQGKRTEAQKYIAKVEELERTQNLQPGALGSVDLKVLAFRESRQHDQAVALLERHVQRPGAKPEEAVALIDYYGRLKRLPQALDWSERAWKTCPPELVGGVIVSVLRGTQPTDQQCERVEGWLKSALEKNPQSPALLLEMADLQSIRGRYDEAQKFYRQVLQKDTQNGVALNNLAWLLALKSGQADEALQLIDRAINALGPLPEYLDTRAVVYLALNKTELAIADLEQAANLDTPSDIRFFHLARAQKMANNTDAAVRTFRKAKELGLDRARLHPVERGTFGKVFDELDR
jgi:tetratricopeptide (TPR) repeat protein